MPKIRRQNVPPNLLNHLRNRARERQIPFEDLILFANWLAANPEVPEGKWFKRFSGMTVCGEGEWVKTFLLPNQLPDGEEVR